MDFTEESQSCWYKFQPHDYELSWDDSEIVLIKQNSEKKHFYNQWAQPRTRNACVLYACVWAISDLTWYEFTLSELLEIVDIAEKDYWWQEDWGMYLPRWVDCVRNWWNKKFPDNKLTSYRLFIWDEIYKKALDLWYTLACSYLISSWYFIDSQDNWVINTNTSKDWDLKWWHAIRIIDPKTIADNYKWKKKYNVYENDKIEKFTQEAMFRKPAYLFIKNSDMEKIFTDVDKTHPFYEHIKFLKEKWITVWYSDWSFRPNDNITRWEMAVMLKRLYELNK